MATQTETRSECSCSCEHCWPSPDNPHDDAGDARFCPRGHDHTREHADPAFSVDRAYSVARLTRDY